MENYSFIIGVCLYIILQNGYDGNICSVIQYRLQFTVCSIRTGKHDLDIDIY